MTRDQDADDPSMPPWIGDLEGTVNRLVEAWHAAAFVITAQGAMGAMCRGDMAMAHQTLNGLTSEQLEVVSISSNAIANLAEDILNGRRAT